MISCAFQSMRLETFIPFGESERCHNGRDEDLEMVGENEEGSKTLKSFGDSL